MDETKAPESAYSGERTTVTGSDAVRGQKATAIAEGTEKDASAKKVGNEETAVGKRDVSEKAAAAKQSGGEKAVAASTARESTPAVGLPEIRRSAGPSLLADFGEFLKRTWKVWAIVAGTILGGMVLVTVQKGMAERARIAKEARQEHAVATVTVETLLMRCGPAAEDLTKEMYPMVLRTITYPGRENEKVVFVFSRTAEEKSDWVLLAMKDGTATKIYETTQAKIAALPCLDSTKE